MKVQLAYPYENHRADTTIDVDDATARLLLREGRARLASPVAHKPAPTDVGRTKEAS